MVTWNASIWLYLWMAGMAGGAYFAAFLAERFAGIKDRKLLRLATHVSIPLAVMGVLFLVIDLGHPLRFWHLFTQFKPVSPMSMGTWILLLWSGIAMVMIILWRVEYMLATETALKLKKLVDTLGSINVGLSALLITYTGVLLAVSNRPLWASTTLLPSLFVASAVSTGLALLVLIAIASNAIKNSNLAGIRIFLDQLFGTTDWAIPNKIIARLAESDVVVIFIELVALVGYVIWLATSTTAGAGAAVKLLTMGTLAIPFWVGVVLLALLIPLGLDIASWGREIEDRKVRLFVATSAVCVILGGLVLRVIITVGGQL